MHKASGRSYHVKFSCLDLLRIWAAVESGGDGRSTDIANVQYDVMAGARLCDTNLRIGVLPGQSRRGIVSSITK